jgi:hypothetical protein
MHTTRRLVARDWRTGIAAGAVLGLLFLGIGARAGMRLVALRIGQPAAFTIEGSIAVSLLGAVTGALLAVVFLLVRTVLPTNRWARGALFWAVCGALSLRGLSPVTRFNAAVFLPLFLLHGALLHAFWCRVHLPRAGRRDAGA